MAKLYIVATPIGNLEDMTLRAIRILKEVHLIACEDTRRTKILLDRHQIKTPIVSYHQHSDLQKIDWILQQLKAGMDIGLVTDAGTPGINDPGGYLVQKVVELADPHIEVIPIPGPNAAVTLLSAAGIPADQYVFLGYLPKKKGRQTLLKRLPYFLKDMEMPVVIYESPERIVRTLKELTQYIPETGRMIIGRELTKQFETIWRGTLTDAQALYENEPPRGEFVVILAPEK